MKKYNQPIIVVMNVEPAITLCGSNNGPQVNNTPQDNIHGA